MPVVFCFGTFSTTPRNTSTLGSDVRRHRRPRRWANPRDRYYG